MALTLDIKGKPWWVGGIIGAVLMAAIIVLTVMFVVKPQQQKIVVLEKKLQELQGTGHRRYLPDMRQDSSLKELPRILY